MHLHTYRDQSRSRRFELVGNGWSVDLVADTAATILMLGFVAAIAALLVR